MSKKVLQCKPVSELELQFNGGESILLRFDILGMSILQENIGNISKLSSLTIPRQCVEIIYAYGKEHNDGLTKEKAEEFVAMQSQETIIAIITEFGDSFGTDNTEFAKKMMAQFLNKRR